MIHDFQSVTDHFGTLYIEGLIKSDDCLNGTQLPESIYNH